MLGNCMYSVFVVWRFFLIFFQIKFFNKNVRNTIRMLNSLDPDQDQQFVGPDLGQLFAKVNQQMTQVGKD